MSLFSTKSTCIRFGSAFLVASFLSTTALLSLYGYDEEQKKKIDDNVFFLGGAASVAFNLMCGVVCEKAYRKYVFWKDNKKNEEIMQTDYIHSGIISRYGSI